MNEGSNIRKLVQTGGGAVLLAIGALGMLFPIIPGVPLILAGVALLGPNHPLLRRLIDRLKQWGSQRPSGLPQEPTSQDGGASGVSTEMGVTRSVAAAPVSTVAEAVGSRRGGKRADAAEIPRSLFASRALAAAQHGPPPQQGHGVSEGRL